MDEKPFSVLYSDAYSRPNTPVNVIIAALILKEIFHLSDDKIVECLMFDVSFQYAQRGGGPVPAGSMACLQAGGLAPDQAARLALKGIATLGLAGLAELQEALHTKAEEGGTMPKTRSLRGLEGAQAAKGRQKAPQGGAKNTKNLSFFVACPAHESGKPCIKPICTSQAGAFDTHIRATS